MTPRKSSKPAEKESASNIGERLRSFAQRYELSVRALADACGGAAAGLSKSTAGRILKGETIFESRSFVKLQIAEALRKFLAQVGKSDEQIESEINTIFDLEDSTMIAYRSTLPREVQQHFGLTRDPFTSDPRNAAEVFNTPQLDKLAKKVEDAINYQGFLAIIGDIGSGKTLLKKRVIDKVQRSGGRQRILWPSFFSMERVGTHSITSYILREFDQSVPSDVVSRAAKVQRVLKNASESGQRVALGFDECHRLNDSTLTALKNFWELGSGGYDRYLGVILFGQPQFDGKLREHNFREIVERLDVVKMPSLGKHARDYAAHRLNVAGGDLDALFETAAFKKLATQADTPQALGNLLNAALVQAFSLGADKVQAAFTKTSADEPEVRSIRKAG